MGRRVRFASEFEVWRDAYLAGVADEHGAEFAELVAQQLAEEVEAFGTDYREFTALISEGRALAQQRAS